MKRREILDRLETLLEREHGGCEQNTCTLSVALRNGYWFSAADSFAGSGAASDEFYGLYDRMRGYIEAKSRQESDEFCDAVPHVDCPHCNAVLWEPEESGYHCDSCGYDIPRLEVVS